MDHDVAGGNEPGVCLMQQAGWACSSLPWWWCACVVQQEKKEKTFDVRAARMNSWQALAGGQASSLTLGTYLGR